MTTDQRGQQLRFDAGTFERPLLDAIIFAQYMLVLIAGVIGFGWLYFTFGFLFDPDTPVLELVGAVPYVIGMLVLAHLLTYLYE